MASKFIQNNHFTKNKWNASLLKKRNETKSILVNKMLIKLNKELPSPNHREIRELRKMRQSYYFGLWVFSTSS